MNLKKTFHTYFNKNEDRSFLSALSFSFLIVSIISSVLLTLSLVAIFSQSLTSSSRRNNQQLLSQTNYAINKIDADANRLRNSMLGNSQIMAFLSLPTADNTIPVLAAREVSKQMLVMPYVESIYLYNASMDLLYSSESGAQLSLSSYKEQEIFDRLNNPDFVNSYKGQPIPGQLDTDSAAAEVITYYFFDNYGPDPDRRSAIIVNFDISILTDPISSIKNLSFEADSNFLLLDQNNTFLTGVLNSHISDPAGWIGDALDILSYDDKYITVQGETYLLTSTDTNTYRWHLVNLTPVTIIFQDLFPLVLFCLLIMILVLIVCWFICRRFARRLNQPIETLARAVKENAPKGSRGFETKEFRMIMDTVNSLYENNEQLRSIQHKSKYALIQSTLNDLISDHHLNPPEHMRQEMEYLGLSWIQSEKICLAVIKIDRCKEVLSHYSADELWTVRFSVVNIVEELGSAMFTCNACSHDDDKFILLTACPRDNDLVAFEESLTALFRTIQENIEKYLHFSVTIAYSTVFQNLSLLPMIYKKAENSLKMKMRLGHGAVIDPYLIDEVQQESFHCSSKILLQLTDQLLVGHFDTAWETYKKITQELYYMDYSEIINTIMRLTHSIYERITEKYPMIQEKLLSETKTVLAGLENAEIKEDIEELFHTFLKEICSQVQQIRSDPSQQSSALIASKVAQIIEANYSDPSLCLAGIAEAIGLSANYTGHIFKQYTQKSVAQYLLDIRMDKIAWYLQNTTLSISNILEKVGLEKNNYFYTRFKNYFGMSLGEYRQKFRIKED